MISERPPRSDRAVPGHWEGELLLGTPDKGRDPGRALHSLLPARPAARGPQWRSGAKRSRRASLVAQPAAPLADLGPGKEMREHRPFSVDSGVQVYFCDPRSPWQRGPTRTPTACCASTSPKAGSPASPRKRSTPSPPNSTADPARRSGPDPGRATHRTDRRAPHKPPPRPAPILG